VRAAFAGYQSLPRPINLIALAAIALVALAFPYLGTSSFYVNIASQVLFFGLFAMSIDLLGGYMGSMPMGHAGIMGVAGYSLGYFIATAKLPIPVAVVLALGVTLLVSLAFGHMTVRTSGVFFSMITLAQGMLVWGLSIKWYEVTGAENGLRGIVRPEFANRYYEFYYFCLVVFALCAAALYLFVKSPFGLTLQGIRDSESRMRMLGYNVELHKLLAFVVSGFFAAFAGMLYAWYNNFISPSAVGLTQSAEGVLMVILGGASTLVGPVIGAAIVVFVKNYVSLYVQRWPTIMGLIFVVTILFAREGVVGAVRPWLARGRKRQRQAAVAPAAAASGGPASTSGSTAGTGEPTPQPEQTVSGRTPG
jgi:branched-chain amino acid transport system permease protein